MFAALAALTLALPAGDDPILAAVKAKVKDPTKPFTMLVMAKVKPGMQDKFEAAFAEAIKETRKEKGNTRYDLNRAADEEGLYALYERWDSVAALEAHMKAMHTQKLLEAIGPMLEGAPQVNVGIPVGE
jgi:quinol monooxygenase YgiN